MPANQGKQPPKKQAARRKGAALRAKTGSSVQPTGKRKSKAKSKHEVAPAQLIAGVGGKAKVVTMAASEVTLKSLSVGNGGAIIKLNEDQAASILKPL
jgi:hypothetical protein